jgi:hypothetical protein
MAKDTVQKGVADLEIQEPRKLNMEEKRKLEKLLLSDIDAAVLRYDGVAKETKRDLIEKLLKTPPAEVKKLFESYTLAKKQQKDAEIKLDKLGWDIAYGGSLNVNTYGTITPQVAAFDEKAEQKREALKSLRRSYVIKLFADHADTQSLFASLAKDLEGLSR